MNDHHYIGPDYYDDADGIDYDDEEDNDGLLMMMMMMPTLLFVLSFLILLLWLHLRIEFSISELCSTWDEYYYLFFLLAKYDHHQNLLHLRRVWSSSKYGHDYDYCDAHDYDYDYCDPHDYDDDYDDVTPPSLNEQHLQSAQPYPSESWSSCHSEQIQDF